MPDVATAYVQVVPTTKGIKEALTNEISGSGDAGGIKIGSAIKKAIVAAGIGAALTKVVSTALSAGGDLQQSFGGLDTIYGDASEAAKQYASEAAKAGISANSYAEQAVSFGASLKAAFGGDTIKAAEAANTAILDMADNSAKMGTDISAIQSAYQGFAKQNYTMLDNLKLGYGGTKTEMERLLADAQKLSGIKYDINNLGDVYEAIHVIQGELGLTGGEGHAPCLLLGIAVYPRRDQRERNAFAALFLCDGKTPAIAGYQQVAFAAAATMPDRSNCMDYVLAWQIVGAGNFGTSGFTAAQSSALSQQLRTCRAVDASVNTAASQQGFIGSIYNSIDLESRNVISNYF